MRSGRLWVGPERLNMYILKKKSNEYIYLKYIIFFKKKGCAPDLWFGSEGLPHRRDPHHQAPRHQVPHAQEGFYFLFFILLFFFFFLRPFSLSVYTHCQRWRKRPSD
jgi:hypothetical protein